jgi:hypothetical protein
MEIGFFRIKQIQPLRGFLHEATSRRRIEIVYVLGETNPGDCFVRQEPSSQRLHRSNKKEGTFQYPPFCFKDQAKAY